MALSQEDQTRLGHLLRRAAFGARPDEWQEYEKLGVAGTTSYLLNPKAAPDPLTELGQEIDGDYLDQDDVGSLRKWWIYRMLHTKRPLEEKMTLFWHNHFATANFKVDNPKLMWRQNEFFRANALGNFRTILRGVSRDPAMLIWLDGEQNRKGKPNENYGRELLELFTMGIGGGYTEKDVKEGARAFTGWRYDRDSDAFLFDPSQHDDNPKTFLGQTGNFNGDDIIDIVVRHPSTARFICTKLFRYFIHEAPSDTDLAPFEQTYFQSAFDIGAVVGAMLTSPAFNDPGVKYAKIKAPAEYVVMVLRTLNAPLSCAPNIGETVRSMGQDLFNPPNVKGWPEGKTWINTMSMVSRINFNGGLIHEMQRRSLFTGNLYTALASIGMPTNAPAAAVDALWQLFLPGHTPTSQTRGALYAYAVEGWNPGEAQFEQKSPGLTNLVLSAPDYQLA